MKRMINKALKKAGWELRRITPLRASMREGLRWLSRNKFPVATVLDVGASDGRWSLDCMAFFSSAKYVLFEPQPAHGQALDGFVSSCTQTVIPIKKAVGASLGRTFFDATDPFGGALATAKGERNIEVEITTIDATVSNLPVEGPYLLKLDTHGFERSILNGAVATLRKCEALVIEAYNYKITAEALLFWELCVFLADRGFRPIDLVDVMHRVHDDSLWQMDLFFIKSSWEGFKCTSYK